MWWSEPNDGVEYMPQVSAEKRASLDPAQRLYMKRAEKMNNQRSMRHVLVRRKNAITGLSLTAFMFCTYFYTIYAMKQEKLGAEFDQIPDAVPEAATGTGST